MMDVGDDNSEYLASYIADFIVALFLHISLAISSLVSKKYGSSCKDQNAFSVSSCRVEKVHLIV